MSMLFVDPNLKTPPVSEYGVETIAAAMAECERVGSMPFQAMMLNNPSQGGLSRFNAALRVINTWAEAGIEGI